MICQAVPLLEYECSWCHGLIYKVYVSGVFLTHVWKRENKGNLSAGGSVLFCKKNTKSLLYVFMYSM